MSNQTHGNGCRNQCISAFIEAKYIFYIGNISWHTTKQKCPHKYIQQIPSEAPAYIYNINLIFVPSNCMNAFPKLFSLYFVMCLIGTCGCIVQSNFSCRANFICWNHSCWPFIHKCITFFSPKMSISFSILSFAFL